MVVKQWETMRDEISRLGAMLGETIREIAGQDGFETVEEMRRLAWDRRSGREQADQRLAEFIHSLDDRRLRIVIRAFTIFLDLQNLAEDRQRIRTLGERARAAYPGPRRESVADAITELKQLGNSSEQVQRLLDRLQIELVFTAHPTDAKRRSVRRKLCRLRELLAESDHQPLPTDRDRLEREIRCELAKLWQTDFLRPWRPSVLNEVERGLSIKPVLWREIPRLMREFRQSLDELYDGEVQLTRPCVTFGSWIGGDRDGHPGVTTDVTRQTLVWLREAAFEFHEATRQSLFDSLSLSERQLDFPDTLASAIRSACARWPSLEQHLSALPPGELCRRWLAVIQWRMEKTPRGEIDAVATGDGYRDAEGLKFDVGVLLDAVRQVPGGELIAEEVEAWLSQIETFGFHLAKLDVRQDARQYRDVLNELLKSSGLSESPESLDEPARQSLLAETLDRRIDIDEQSLSPLAQDTLRLFNLLRKVSANFGPHAIGGHVISMTAVPSDVMTVLWLWRQAGIGANGEKPNHSLAIIPLFETIEDLQQAPQILSGMLASTEYRKHLREQQDQQTVMLGYSDSTKDGGYLSACWSLHQAQQELVELAEKHGVELTFFHGRGGSLGRGGGPAARGILSLPVGTFRGSLRLTEQGEVLSERYDDPAIAHRHLEQVVWSSLLAAGKPSQPDDERYRDLMATLSETSFRRYRELVEQPDFVTFFRRVTPISEIEQLPIGSRPSRRRGGASLSDLRAIPWVFSWTQARCLIPAWYGLGTAIEAVAKDPVRRETLMEMYQKWPFFRACIDNAELALAKTDLEIAEHYASLAGEQVSLREIASTISDEYQLACKAVLTLTQNQSLLEGTPWLKESIRIRNRYIDPLNLIQVELLRRADQREADEELRHLTRLTINGVVAGMRTSG